MPHTCPVCETTDIITIHDDLYICDAEGCGVLYDPTTPGAEPFWPHRYAIGFCPRCKANAKGCRDEITGDFFQCPECDYEWHDARTDGKVLAMRFEQDGEWFA